MSPAPEFSRRIEAGRLRDGGERVTIAATEGERAALAQRLGIEAMALLEASVGLTPVGAGVVAAEGEVRARVTQVCVVSLEPFEQALEIPLRLVFRPGTEADLVADQTIDPESEDEVPYEGGGSTSARPWWRRWRWRLIPGRAVRARCWSSRPHRSGRDGTFRRARAPAQGLSALCSLRGPGRPSGAGHVTLRGCGRLLVTPVHPVSIL